MKLGKLLAAGKSVISGCGEVSYRASKQVYLPKFGGATNPFKPEAPQLAAENEPKETGPSAVATPPCATRIAREQAHVSLPAPSASGPEKSGTWAGKFNPASIFRAMSPRPAPMNAAAAPKEATQTELKLQTEMKLDSVKVLHNDLSDVDVEVVPIKSRASAAELPAPKKSWEFLGERLFGVEAT